VIPAGYRRVCGGRRGHRRAQEGGAGETGRGRAAQETDGGGSQDGRYVAPQQCAQDRQVGEEKDVFFIRSQERSGKKNERTKRLA